MVCEEVADSGSNPFSVMRGVEAECIGVEFVVIVSWSLACESIQRAMSSRTDVSLSAVSGVSGEKTDTSPARGFAPRIPAHCGEIDGRGGVWP
jgi:hypothetical protein